VPQVGATQNNTYVCRYIEYCAMENLGGKIKFMTRSGALIPWALFSPFVFTVRLLVFVERSSTIECYRQPPPLRKKWKRLSAVRARLLIARVRGQPRPSNYNCTVTILQLQLYNCNLQASLNHRANACSCYTSMIARSENKSSFATATGPRIRKSNRYS
jgi:hypothetical protein